MTYVFLILLLVSIAGLVVGLIMPKVFQKIFKGKTNRKTIGLVFGLCILVFFIATGLTAKDVPVQNKTDNSASLSSPSKNNTENTQPVSTNSETKQPEATVKKYEIVKTANQRFDKATTYYVLIDAVDLTNDTFKTDMKRILKKIVDEKGTKLSIEIHDNRDSLDVSYKQYGDMSLGRARTQEEENTEAVHHIANYSGELSGDIYFNTLMFFPAAFKDNQTIGKYVETIEFNAKDYNG